ncbi:MAG TPA: hypothetical protein PKC43_13135 [Phycisphaerales bacterium]|nr:hypothetical protein [Phycisphaerales bacterium]HMP38376.1 hypothetical protein [Phycisphaerales bacterium]
MKIDYVAFQQATRVAGIGFLIQFGLALLLLVFGLATGDTTTLFASFPVLAGILAWLSLVVLFNQHRLERIESLEADELATSRGTTIFDRDVEATRVAARRLRLMHTWFMPAASLAVAAFLVGMGLWIIRWFGMLGELDGTTFRITQHAGWALAICAGSALICFIFSRFVAGMSKQPAWQNLRGGAGLMVANALVAAAAAIGFGFLIAGRPGVLEGVAFGVAIFMFALAAEILLNFVLHLYRPRRPGEIPRPAFDSRVLSLLAAPDSIVRTINEAVNYQFGFDITSSWGYQLLLRSFGWLLIAGTVAMFALTCLVTVQPDQQAVKLRFGKLMSVHGSGPMLKLPWPIETVEIHEVGRIGQLSLSINPVTIPARLPPGVTPVNFWTNDDPSGPDRALFLTGASRLGLVGAPTGRGVAPAPVPIDGETEEEARIGANLSMVDAEVALQYRIRPDGGLLKFLSFSSDATGRRSELPMRERAMRSLALRELVDYFSRLPLEDVLSPGRSGVLDGLRQRIQARFDAPENDIGVEVVSIIVPVMRPPATVAEMFEEFSISVQARRERVDNARRNADVTMALLARDAENADRIVEAIDRWRAARQSGEIDVVESLRREIEEMLVAARGQPAAKIESAEATRWRTQMRALADANRLLGDQPMFDAAPELYRQRQVMRVLAQALPRTRIKYLLALPPERIHFDLEMQEVDTGLNFLDTVEQARDANTARHSP